MSDGAKAAAKKRKAAAGAAASPAATAPTNSGGRDGQNRCVLQLLLRPLLLLVVPLPLMVCASHGHCSCLTRLPSFSGQGKPYLSLSSRHA